MENYNEAFTRLKSLECPAGYLEERVQELLSIYDIADENTSITRDKSYDREGLEAYRIKFAHQAQSKIVLAKSGTEDYVVRVVDILDE